MSGKTKLIVAESVYYVLIGGLVIWLYGHNYAGVIWTVLLTAFLLLTAVYTTEKPTFQYVGREIMSMVMRTFAYFIPLLPPYLIVGIILIVLYIFITIYWDPIIKKIKSN